MSLDPDRTAALRHRFVAAAGDDPERIEASLAEGDLEGARGLAHSLAGRSGLFGLTELGEPARLTDESDPGTLPERARGLLAALRDLSQDG